MKILVAGTGGVGGYFGGLLAHAGHAVAFLAHGPHLEAIQRDGLRVHSVHGDFAIRPVGASDRPEELPAPDCVLVAVKHYDLQTTARQLRAVVGEDTTVVPLMNGVDAHEVLQRELDADGLQRGPAASPHASKSRASSVRKAACVESSWARRMDDPGMHFQSWSPRGTIAGSRQNRLRTSSPPCGPSSSLSPHSAG